MLNDILKTYKFGLLFFCCLSIILDYSCKEDSFEKQTNNEMVTDLDGNLYNTIKIGNQIWLKENLKVTHYRNGDPILYKPDSIDWCAGGQAAYCNYNNDDNNVEIHGRLYNWQAVIDQRNIAPEGWHIPNNNDWNILIEYLGGDGIAGGKLKMSGLDFWSSPNTGATNSCGFSAYPSGYRYCYGYVYDLAYYRHIGENAYFWTLDIEYYNGGIYDYSYHRILSYNSSSIDSVGSNAYGYSVRCVKDD